MTLVVKIGEAALDNKELVKKFVAAILSLCQEGHQVVVVHGGGAVLSRTLKQLGCGTNFVNGLRVTDSQTRDVAIMVLAGQLNKRLVAAVGAAGQPAIGICGGDLGMFRASKKQTPDLGFVGDIRFVNTEGIQRLWAAGIMPVVSSLALGYDGERECRPDGCGVRGSLRCACAHLPDRCFGSKGCRWHGHSLARCEGDPSHSRAGDREWRHAAQARSLLQRAQEGCHASQNTSGVECRGSAGILHPSHRMRHGGDCFMNRHTFDGALERRNRSRF